MMEDLLVVTIFLNLKAVGSWTEVLLPSMDFIVSQNFLVFVPQEANFCLKKTRFSVSNCLCVLVPCLLK